MTHARFRVVKMLPLADACVLNVGAVDTDRRVCYQ